MQTAKQLDADKPADDIKDGEMQARMDEYSEPPYRTMDQQLREVGMSRYDFI